jgi:hypothetical protein
MEPLSGSESERKYPSAASLVIGLRVRLLPYLFFESVLRFYLQCFNIRTLRNLELGNQTTVLQSVIRNRLFGQEIGSCHWPTWVLAENAATSFRCVWKARETEDRGHSLPKRWVSRCFTAGHSAVTIE